MIYILIPASACTDSFSTFTAVFFFLFRFFDDLRPYALVQFVPCIAIPVMAILLPPMYTHSAYWLWAAGMCFLSQTSSYYILFG